MSTVYEDIVNKMHDKRLWQNLKPERATLDVLLPEWSEGQRNMFYRILHDDILPAPDPYKALKELFFKEKV